jgi:hypothetical protein
MASISKRTKLPRSLKLHWLCDRKACGNPLAFIRQQQQQTQWCWAAVSVAVNLYYHPTSGRTQCAVVNTALNQTTCCQNGSTAQCNQPWFLDQALQIVGNLNAFTGGKATLNTVQTEVNNCRPICMRIGWTAGGGHFVTVFGYSGTNINIADPWYGTSVVNHTTFPAGYNGGGTWTHSYTTRS